MSESNQTLYFSGYCYWSMEAVFSHLRGVKRVLPGWVSSGSSPEVEAVCVCFSPEQISAATLISIHLSMHRSDIDTGIKRRYPTRVFSTQRSELQILQSLIEDISHKSHGIFYCKSERLSTFRRASQRYENYYIRGPEKPYCQQYIRPRLNRLSNEWPNFFIHKDVFPNEEIKDQD
jgi:peptide-methionine (S)-S-oxide reductase